MREKIYTEQELVAFGNYLLSNERKELFKKTAKKQLKDRLSVVCDSDLQNFFGDDRLSE